MSSTRRRCGILGATGTVGQRFVLLLEKHPQLEVVFVAASQRNSDRRYEDVCNWKMSTPMPSYVKKMTLQTCSVDALTMFDVAVVFSALDSDVAGPIEEELAANGIAVFSNAKNHRMDTLVPLVVPTVNADHLKMIKLQQAESKSTGYIVCNANCSTTGLCVVLKPLHDAFGIEKLFVTTLQAISGAGYPGVSSMDILDNVIPYISGEEEKMETEPQKILGTLLEGRLQVASFAVSAQCNRVAVMDGHTESVSIKFGQSVTPAKVIEVLRNYRTPPSTCPSMPSRPILVLDQTDRPQPRLDRNQGNGMTVTVGRVRGCPIFDVKLTLLSHNTVIGAAGGALLNAELAIEQGLL